ncbi:hypothetical protein ACVWYG_002580 [Pedobacter sp. UYEF25]
MSFISKADLGTHIYNEKVDVITRGNNALVQDAIDAAINQAEGYLNRYDYATIFATTDATERKKFAALIIFIKDIAIWNLLKLCNAGMSLELAKECYDDAIAELMRIQSGKLIYTTWPVIAANIEFNQGFTVTSNPKRSTYY